MQGFWSLIAEIIRRYAGWGAADYSVFQDHHIGIAFVANLLPLLLTVSGIGIFLLKRWARSLYGGLITLYGFLGVALFVFFSPKTPLRLLLIAVVLSMVIFFHVFLTSPKVKEPFK